MWLWILVFCFVECDNFSLTHLQQLEDFNKTFYSHFFGSKQVNSNQEDWDDVVEHGIDIEDDYGAHLAKKLRSLVHGDVFSRLDAGYEFARSVHNGGCHARPLLVLVPLGTRDVAVGVKFARRRGLQLSVRSGGHSYTCTSIREGGLHMDMRKVNKVEMVNRTNHLAVKLGPGSTWGRVLDIVPPSEFTMVHGQCTSVGVGGYLLGGGLNLASFNKYGFGAEHVLAYKMVTADGDITTVEEDKTTVLSTKQSPRRNSQLVKMQIMHNEDNHLMFALGGAGSSFGIVTEFLYKIYPWPETLPIYLLVWVNHVKDLLNLQEAAFNPHCPYNFLISQYYLTGLVSNLVGLANFHTVLKNTNRPVEELFFLQVTDISKNAPRQTDIRSAIAYLKQYDVEIVVQDPIFVSYFSNLCCNQGLIPDYEHQYMGVDEGKNPQKIASANIAGIKNITEIASSFLLDAIMGCDYCFWVIIFVNPSDRRSKNLSLNPGMYQKNTLYTELTCLFKDYEANKSCPENINKFKSKFFRSQRKLNRSVVQYVNTPSCDEEHFGQKYWGRNYEKLVKIKEFWDPDNVFNHCQSVGSKNSNCCPKS